MVPNFGATYITNLSNIGELMQPSHPYIRNDKRADATRSPLIKCLVAVNFIIRQYHDSLKLVFR